MRYTDIAIVGGGLAGSTAAAMLGRAGIPAILIDPHPVYRPDFRVEKLSGQQQIERVFRGLKDGDWLGWGPMYHWTDSKIRVHAFYCMLGISLLQYVHRQSQSAWPDLTVEQLLEQLTPMQQFTLLYPPLGDKGPNRVATVLSKQTLVQQALAHSLGLDELCSTQRR